MADQAKGKGPAVDNTATSNLDPPIDIGSKEGFKDTITSSIVKELSKKAYTIPDDTVLSMLLRNSLSSGPRAAISWIYIPSKAFKLLVRQYSRPIESKKEDVYNEFHALTFSTYGKGLSAFNAEFNGYLAKLTIAKIDIDPSLILNRLNIEYLMADILEESRNLAIEAYRAAYEANSSNSTPNSNSNPSKKGKNKKKGKKKASYNIKGQNYSAKSAEQASFMLGSYNLAIEEEEEESDSSSNSSSSSDSNTQLVQLLVLKGYKKRKDFKGKGLKTSSNNKAKYKDNQPRRRPRDPAVYNSWLYDTGSTDHISNGKERPAGIGSITLEVLSRKGTPTYTKLVLDNVLNIVMEIPSNSIRKKDYRPIIEDAIVSEAMEPKKRYKAPYQSPCKTREPKPLTGTRDLPYVLREPVIEGNKVVEKAISSPTLKEPNIERYRAIGARVEAIIPLEKRSKSLKFTSRTEECKLLAVLGSKTYLVYIPSRRAVLKTSTVKFIEDNTVLSQPTDNTALKGELVDLDLDLDRAVSPDPSNLNTKKPISIEIGPSKLEPYESSSNSELDEPSPDKPINPVIVESTRPTISIIKPELPEAFPQTIKPIFAPKPIEVIAPNQPITNEPLNNSDLISEEDEMQLDYYKLLAKTSSYILSFVYKARKRVISKDSTPITYKQVLKLPKDERSKWLEAITKEFIQLLELGVFKFLPRSPLPSNYKLITYRNVLKVKKDAKNRPIKYKSQTYTSTSIPPTWRILLAIASNKAIYKLLLKYSYNPSTPNIIKLSKALYGVFYNAKTCYFIVTYIDECLFIGPDIGYITDLKKQLNKVYAIEDLEPAAYFLGPGLVSQLQLEEDITSHLCNSTEIKLYQSLVGTAIYIMLLTRVDISFTVQWLSRSLNRPTKLHLNAAKNLFKYLNSTKDYSICFSCNGNTVADLGPKLSNSSNTTTKLSRDFHSKDGPRPLTTTSTTIVDSRNGKGSSRTSIINSSLVPIGFSDSDFAGDKATSKSTYSYLYKLAGRPISWKTKGATTIALSTLEAETDGLIEAIREVQDNQGSITIANNPALHARTKHTLLKFRYVREQVKAKIVTIIYLNTKSSKRPTRPAKTESSRPIGP
ncbi:hypothetical protein P8C59_005292 [Phyllachora maydis]|uniref:Reverse transcriptase Ty1/copia-type domain-containing protein n=1 Tax=Phyllachora maydis TaxID=1825666 RepID=A0AAD9I594_9PEZI|nr:hypothetical protein P8C59_005292 [Phyllachora maydis]